MATNQILQKAPIKESVIDFRCRTMTPITRELAEKLQKEFGYEGKRRDIVQAAVSLNLNDAKSPTSTQSNQVTIKGVRFESADGKLVAQAKIDGLTFSRIAPYTSWDKIMPEALRLWQIYCSALGVKELSRIGVRYINRLAFPADAFSKQPSRFLSTPPPEPMGASESSIVPEWMTRIVLLNADEKNNNAIVTQLSDQSVDKEGTYSVILDFDVFTHTDLPNVKDEPAMVTKLESLRALKNRLFFSSVSDEALNPYK